MSDLLTELQQTLGEEYALERETERTATARQFIARERIFNRAVLITVLDATFVGDLDFERFFTAAERTAGLDHPGIVPPLALGAAAGLPYIVTPYVPGVTLRARLCEQPPLSLEDVVGILRDLAVALEYAHGRGAMHLDISPDHILLSQQKARLTSFGIDRDLAGSQRDQAAVARSSGALAYRAPEQLRGEDVDHRADLFAWGCAAYEMLTGMAPFARDGLASTAVAVIDDAPAPITLARRDVPSTLVRLVMRCLASDPRDRPASAANIVQVLQSVDVSERALAERTLTPAYVPAVPREPTGKQAAIPAAPEKVARWNARRIAPFAAAALAVFGIGGWMATRESVPAEKPLPPVVRPSRIAGSVVVLPVSMPGANAVETASGVGLGEEFARALAKEGAQVIGRLGAASLMQRGLDARAVARELGAESALTGTMAREGDSLRINMALLNVGDGAVRWTEGFTTASDALPQVGRIVAQRVSDVLRGAQRAGIEVDSTSARPAGDPAARGLLLRGYASLHQLGITSVRDAATLFGQAADLDPSLAPAHAAFALATAIAPVFGALDAQPAFDRAMPAITRARALDSNSVDAQEAQAFVHLGRAENRAAESAFKRALGRDSTRALTWSGYALLASRVGDHAAARIRLARARRLEPTSLPIRAWLAQVALAEGKLDEAERESRAVIVADSTVLVALLVRADALIALGRAADAVSMLEASAAVARDASPELQSMLAYSHAAAGNVDRARELMLAMRDASGGALPPSGTLAATLASLGDVDSAIGILDRATARRDPAVVQFGSSGRFSVLRKDPRGAAILTSLERW